MAVSHGSGHRRSVWVIVAWVVSLVVFAGLGVVFGRWAFGTPELEDAAESRATVVVSSMTVGRSMPVMVSASWVARPFGVGAAEGVLTSLSVADGATVNVGDVLYTVDLRPVVAAVGTVPAFRDLTRGDTGADVVQLQQFLAAVGLFDGEADGEFDYWTAVAVEAWQEGVGVESDGVVRAGDIVYASRLPTRVRLVEDMAVGDRLMAGDVVLSSLDGVPEFAVTVLSGSTLSATLPITVTVGDQVVETVVSSTRSDQGGASVWSLTRVDGSSVCADWCDQVALDPALAVYPGEQVVTPAATGPGVPAAAVWFTASGEPYLVSVDGTQLPVTIVSQGQGGVVVDGVELGTVVVLADQTTATTPVASDPPVTSDPPVASDPSGVGSGLPSGTPS